MRRLLSRLTPLLLVTGALWIASPCPTAAAEEEEGLDEVSRQVKEQMDKIIRLMQENETALLEISTGKTGARPKAVDVKPPALPPRESAEGSESKPPRTGEEAIRSLEEMIRGQRSGAGEIPGELEELVRMVPQ